MPKRQEGINLKTVIYARKSRGTIEELNSQISICKEYCNKNEVYYKNIPQIVTRELWLEANSQLREDKELLSVHNTELQAVKAIMADNKEKLSKLNNLYLMNNISQAELTEKSAVIKDRIDLLELKQQRLEGYSLFKISQEIQGKIIRLEELKADADINDLVVLVDYVQYYKDSEGLFVKTIFKEQ